MDDYLNTEMTFPGRGGDVQAYLARPQGAAPRPAVIVIHEIWGLTDHIRDVAGRIARQGYVALAPNLFSRPGLAEALTPAALDAARRLMSSVPVEKRRDITALEAALEGLPAAERPIAQRASRLLWGGAMPYADLLGDLAAAVDTLSAQPFVRPGRVGGLGFCFGGGLSFALACQAPLAACVVFYGSNPDPIEKVEDIPCPVLGLYGGDDRRIDQGLERLMKAMVDYHKDFELRLYPGAPHAFFNDTNPQTYRPAAAHEAWERVLRFFERTLAAG